MSECKETAVASCGGETGAPHAYRAIFFDLDGTLLPMELEEFLSSYFAALTGFVAAQGLDAEMFSGALKAGIGAMTSHEDEHTNAEAFWEAFLAREDDPAAEGRWPEIFGDFYENEFGKIGAGVQANPVAAHAVETLAAKGYPLVLATMPMFPRRAVEWRLAWAGVDSALFARITTFENSTSVKPKPVYCAENLAACGLAGSDVLMVGNNTVEDGAFSGLGADLYLVTDHLLDPTGAGVGDVPHGSLEEFTAWAQALPACTNPAAAIDDGAVARSETQAVLAANSRLAEGEVARAVEAAGAFNAEAAGDMGGAFGGGSAAADGTTREASTSAPDASDSAAAPSASGTLGAGE